MFRKVFVTALLVLGTFGVTGVTHAQLLGGGTTEDSIQVTVGTTTQDVTFSSPTLQGAKEKLQDILFYLRAFDSSDVIETQTVFSATSTNPPTGGYDPTVDIIYGRKVQTQNPIDAISELAQAECHVFDGSFEIGDRDAEVLEIQKFLNESLETRIAQEGPGSPGEETDYFGSLTFSAVYAFQAFHSDEVLAPVGLSNPTGYWGPSTRAYANILSGCDN